jgi:hypothetical protein
MVAILLDSGILTMRAVGQGVLTLCDRFDRPELYVNLKNLRAEV